MNGNRMSGPGEPEWYEIRLGGILDTRWAEWFHGLSFAHDSDGTTILSGPVVDQAALHGFLRKVRDLGLPLLSVLRLDPKPTEAHEVSDSTYCNASRKETTT